MTHHETFPTRGKPGLLWRWLGSGAARSCSRPRFFPHLERLETRELLTSWYVATTGLDVNPGTLALPFRTIQKAALLAQPGDTVFIRQGVYRETITPARSGASGAPITFTSYNGEAVTISGADPIPASAWTAYNSTIYRANMPWTLGDGNQVFVDGAMMNEARFPNSSLDVSHPTKLSVTGFSYSGPYNNLQVTVQNPALTQPAGYWVGATINITMGFYQWVQSSWTVTASAPGSVTFVADLLDQPGGTTPTVYLPTQLDPFWLSKKFSELDAPGEWFREPTNSTLYLQTPASDNPASHTVEVKSRINAFDLSNRSYINVTNLGLFASTITTNENSTHVTLDSLNAKYVSQSTDLSTLWVSQMETTGIQLKGAYSLIENSTIAYSSGNGILLMGNYSRAINNVIHDVDYMATDAAPICTGNVYGAVYPPFTGLEIGYNTIYNAGRSGIQFARAQASRIDHNLVYNVLIQGVDGGGLYTIQQNGQGTRIDHNVVHDLVSNPIPGFIGWTTGIQIDDDSQNYVIDHNVTWNSIIGIMFNPSYTNISLYNNTIDAQFYSIGAWTSHWANSVMVLENNIFLEPIAWDDQADHWTGWSPQVSQRNNLLAPFDGGSDPRVVDAVNHNYELQPTSPAVHAGVPIPNYTDGYTGPAPDLGAYPLGQAPWPVGAGNFSLTGLPDSTPSGTPLTFTLTARDSSGQLAAGYRGTVHFTSSDSRATVPADYTFTAADGGSHTFTVAFGSLGSQTLTAADTAGAFEGVARVNVPSLLTATTLTSSTATVVYGQSVSFTARVTNAGVPLTTGTVTFSREGGIVLGTVSLNSSGQAIWSGTTIPAGSSPHVISAVYNPAPTYLTSSATTNTTVTPAPLTIRADNKTRAYGQANPSFTASLSGLVPGDTAAVVTGLTLSTTATTASAVGTYSITGAGATAANYAITYAAGSLTVTRAALTITPDNKTRVYGQANPLLTATLSGLVAGDTAAVVTGLTLRTSATSATGAGAYGITAGGATASNYTITFGSGTLTITPAPLTVTADNQTRGYGSSNPTLTASFSGFVNGDTRSVLSGRLNISTPATASSHAGTYSITASGLTSANYTISYAAGTLTVSPAPLTITADNKTKVAGTSLPTLTATYRGLVNGDTTAAVQGLNLTTSSSDTAGSYPIVASGATAADYAITFVNGTLTVTPAAAIGLSLYGPSTMTAGNVADVTVTVWDAYGNVATGYRGTVHFASNSGAATMPADYTFTAADAGVHTFAAGLSFYQSGNQAWSVVDTVNSSLTAALATQVSPAAAVYFDVTAPATVTAGQPFSVTVTARDPYGNQASGYTGTVTVSSSDPQAAPLQYTFTAADQGVTTLTATLLTAGPQSLFVSDTVAGGVVNLSVTPAAVASLQFTSPGPVTAGVPFQLVVTAFDAYGNVATGYLGTLRLTRTDGIDPAVYTLTATDAGTYAFTVTAANPGPVSFFVADQNNSLVVGDHLDLIF
jgi:hypothetical protein